MLKIIIKIGKASVVFLASACSPALVAGLKGVTWTTFLMSPYYILAFMGAGFLGVKLWLMPSPSQQAAQDAHDTQAISDTP